MTLNRIQYILWTYRRLNVDLRIEIYFVAKGHRERKMGYTHASHIDALNQNIA
ncbi:5,10-methylenetetrahydrofolate reductase, partial [Vibrio vulnificus]